MLYNLVMQNSHLKIIGMMSGTSLDGIDACLVDIKYQNNNFEFEICAKHTLDYSEKIRKKILKDYDIHWHDYFEIEMVVEGSADHILNGKTYSLSKGDIYLLTPVDFHEKPRPAPTFH